MPDLSGQYAVAFFRDLPVQLFSLFLELDIFDFDQFVVVQRFINGVENLPGLPAFTDIHHGFETIAEPP